MNAQIKDQWISALRGTQYGKTTGFLRKNNCYCAIGVLCDLYSKETKIPWELNVGTGGRFSICGFWNHAPESVLTWAGINEDKNPVEYEKYVRIVNLNDHEDMTFALISDYIDQNFSCN